MSAWKEQRGADGSHQAVPARMCPPSPTAPVAEIPAPKPFFTPWLSFVVGVFVGASLMAGALVIGLQRLSALPH